MLERPSRTDLHLYAALLWAKRSVCKRTKVGVIITTNDLRRVLSIGYNGPAKGLHHSQCSEEEGKCGCLHAEDNAVSSVDSTIPNKTLFTTVAPCYMCAQRIVQANVKTVIYIDSYRDNKGLGVLRQCNVRAIQYNTLREISLP